ncbi:MAG: hypothetical protein N3A66_10395, partial [Planctomycetota bacterium]|nr:hypothetical protein [Planctomycetota bacterium]
TLHQGKTVINIQPSAIFIHAFSASYAAPSLTWLGLTPMALFLERELHLIGPVGDPIVMKSVAVQFGNTAPSRPFQHRTLVIVDAE